MKKNTKLRGKELRPILEKELGPLTFAMFMRANRTLFDLTQNKMARKLGISKTKLIHIEKGRRLVTPKEALKFTRKLKIPSKLAIKLSLQDQVSKLNMGIKVELVAV